MLLNNVGVEDLTDPNDDKNPDQLDDQTYLMYEALTLQNFGTFKFDKFTRANIGLLAKDFLRPA